MLRKILVNGTFDIIHRGHLELLNYAKSLGGSLTVAIDSDERVTKLKGSSRPIHNQNDRKFMLENIKCVDQVVIFNNDQELIDTVKNHDIMVKGSDYRGRSIIGKTYCKQVIYFDRLENYSTTNTIEHIINRR
jgi:D-beta-D-heptose 7-phosphate kinase/D-beta-D-heptose 1-phosphate adenosyltransferase